MPIEPFRFLHVEPLKSRATDGAGRLIEKIQMDYLNFTILNNFKQF